MSAEIEKLNEMQLIKLDDAMKVLSRIDIFTDLLSDEENFQLVRNELEQKVQFFEENIMRSEVHHPSHYNLEGRKECWDEMIDIFGPDAVAIWDSLTAYKYFYRAGSKKDNPMEQDLRKIDEYFAHLEYLREKFPEKTVSNTLPSECYWRLRESIDRV